ncbi:S66 peptidase family protein [Nonlabens antarcticus]|uniref:S66 peptidase family protein n=1 Tax=Nonlabens antarcticus TaxID=392714 RepID=UPI001890CDE1|nr:LD-carboxypeptidase [Nonlabens antarcticus]
MPELLAFPTLELNSHIRILCTARIASIEKLAPAIGWLKSQGYKVSLGKTIGKKHHQYGGTDQERLEDFQEALEDPNVNAIWIARGGYGSIKIVDSIDLSVLNGNNKLLLGYSDVTNLHGLWQRNGLQSVHCFMPQEYYEKPEEVLRGWNRVVSGGKQSLTLENNQDLPAQSIIAPIVGGNLSVLLSMLGSSTFPDVEDHILFIEDLDEYLYHIDRLMTTLKRAGKLDNLKALLVGGMTDMRDHEIPFGQTVKEIISAHTGSCDYPVIFDFPAGHGIDNFSFVLGKSTAIDIRENNITISQ